jgi:hypothetical protein
MIIKTLWVSQVLYTTALALTKASIIASFHRLFPTRPIRVTMLSLSALITAVWLINILTTIFQCSPIRAAWDITIVPPPKCLPIVKVYYFSTAFSILTDILLVVIPLPFFWTLKLPLREKWIVSALFGCGLFAAVASIMRITVLKNVQSLDVSVGSVPTLNWSVVEVGTGIICACVPCLKPLFKRLLPGKFFSAVGAGSLRAGGGASVRGNGKPLSQAEEVGATEMVAMERKEAAESVAEVVASEMVGINGRGVAGKGERDLVGTREFV